MDTKIIFILSIALACTYTYIYANNQAKKTWNLMDKMNKSLDALEKVYPNWNIEDNIGMIKNLRKDENFQSYLIPYAKSFLDYHEHEGDPPKQKTLFDIAKLCNNETLRDRALESIRDHNAYYKKMNKTALEKQNL